MHQKTIWIRINSQPVNPIGQRGLKFPLSLGLSWLLSKMIVKASRPLAYLLSEASGIVFTQWQERHRITSLVNWRSCWASSVRAVWLRHNGLLYFSSCSGFSGCSCGYWEVKKSMYEIDYTLVPPSVQSDSASLSALESLEVFTCGRIKKLKNCLGNIKH